MTGFLVFNQGKTAPDNSSQASPPPQLTTLLNPANLNLETKEKTSWFSNIIPTAQAASPFDALNNRKLTLYGGVITVVNGDSANTYALEIGKVFKPSSFPWISGGLGLYSSGDLILATKTAATENLIKLASDSGVAYFPGQFYTGMQIDASINHPGDIHIYRNGVCSSGGCRILTNMNYDYRYCQNDPAKTQCNNDYVSSCPGGKTCCTATYPACNQYVQTLTLNYNKDFGGGIETPGQFYIGFTPSYADIMAGNGLMVKYNTSASTLYAENTSTGYAGYFSGRVEMAASNANPVLKVIQTGTAWSGYFIGKTYISKPRRAGENEAGPGADEFDTYASLVVRNKTSGDITDALSRGSTGSAIYAVANSADPAFIARQVGAGTAGQFFGRVDISGGDLYVGSVASPHSICLNGVANCISSWPSGGALTGSGTANYLPKWTGAAALGNSVVYETGGNIGIGVAGANAKLTVTDGTAIGGATTNTLGLYNTSAASAIYAQQSGTGYAGYFSGDVSITDSLNVLGGGVFGNNVYINSGLAWHSKNDGVGSTLDADLLDGTDLYWDKATTPPKLCFVDPGTCSLQQTACNGSHRTDNLPPDSSCTGDTALKCFKQCKTEGHLPCDIKKCDGNIGACPGGTDNCTTNWDYVGQATCSGGLITQCWCVLSGSTYQLESGLPGGTYCITPILKP